MHGDNLQSPFHTVSTCVLLFLLDGEERFPLLIKQSQRFGFVCQTEMSATRNCFAALI